MVKEAVRLGGFKQDLKGLSMQAQSVSLPWPLQSQIHFCTVCTYKRRQLDEF